MLDTEFYFEDYGRVLDHDELYYFDLTVSSSDCSCTVCKQKQTRSGHATTALFEAYRTLDPRKQATLSDHQYMLMPIEVPAFVFKTRVWGKIPFFKAKFCRSS